jgi:hypothetical protein
MVTALGLIIQFASAGRAWRVWAITMLGGADTGDIIASFLTGTFFESVRYSHLLLALALVSAGSLVVALLVPADRDDRAPAHWWLVPAGIWTSASAAAALSLSSPGTVPANHVVEWIACALVVIAIVAARRTRLRRPIGLLATALVVWMASQDIVLAGRQRPAIAPDVRAGELRLVERVRSAPTPVLSESALWPLLAGRSVVVADPFAARVVFRARPDIERDLLDRIARREFSLVILEFDPATVHGRGMYDNQHFSRAVYSALERSYRFDDQVLPNAFVFVPR